MSGKQDTSDEAQAVPDNAPQGDGNPFERMRHFRVQRDAVMRPTDGRADDDGGPSPSDGSGSAEDEAAGQASQTGEHQTAVEEYRRRQCIDRDV